MNFTESSDWFEFESGPVVGQRCNTSGYGDTDDGREHEMSPLPLLLIDRDSLIEEDGLIWARSNNQLVNLHSCLEGMNEELMIGACEYIETAYPDDTGAVFGEWVRAANGDVLYFQGGSCT